MAVRLGNVLYWAGLIAAILLLLVGVILVWDGLLAAPWAGKQVFVGSILIVIAPVSYGIGWAARYILRGLRKDD